MKTIKCLFIGLSLLCTSIQPMELIKEGCSALVNRLRSLPLWQLSPEEVSFVKASLENIQFFNQGPLDQLNFPADTKKLIADEIVKNRSLFQWLIKKSAVTCVGHKKNFFAMTAAFDPTETLVVTASNDWSAKVWNAQTGELIHSLRHKGEVFLAVFNPAGTQIATSWFRGGITLWDVKTGQEIRTLPHDQEVTSIEFSADGSTLLSCGHDDTARMWNTRMGVCVGTFDGISKAQIDRSQTKIVGNSRTRAFIFDIKKREYFFAQAHTDKSPLLHDVTFNRATTRAVTCAYDDPVALVWNIQQKEILHRFQHESVVVHAIFNDQENIIITRAQGAILTAWDAITGQKLYSLHEGLQNGNYIYPAFNREGTLLAATCQNEEEQVTRYAVRLFDTRTGHLLFSLLGHTNLIRSAEFNRAGTHILTASNDGTAKIWDLDPLRNIRGTFSLEQAMLLAYLYEIDQCNFLYRQYRKDKTKIVFDFVKYPQFKLAFNSLSEPLKKGMLDLVINN